MLKFLSIGHYRVVYVHGRNSCYRCQHFSSLAVIGQFIYMGVKGFTSTRIFFIGYYLVKVFVLNWKNRFVNLIYLIQPQVIYVFTRNGFYHYQNFYLLAFIGSFMYMSVKGFIRAKIFVYWPITSQKNIFFELSKTFRENNFFIRPQVVYVHGCNGSYLCRNSCLLVINGSFMYMGVMGFISAGIFVHWSLSGGLCKWA